MSGAAHSDRPAILVTGGAGYIGSHTCKALSRAGFTPIAFDNLSRGFAPAVKWGPLEIGDIRDDARLDAVFTAYKPIAVLHFAALAYVGESVSDPEMYYACNVAGACALTQAMRRAGLSKIVFSSTCATYGLQGDAPIPEDAAQAPINPYGFTKLIVERLLRDVERAHGVRSVILRYFNAAGADPDGEIGENHDPETHAIPLAIEAALGRRAAFTLYGDDYPTPDGSAVRDYVHVADLADAHVAALRRLLGGGESGAYNLGVGRGVSVLEMCAAVQRVTGKQTPLVRGARREGDPPSLVAAPGRAREDLGWSPQRCDIDGIVRDAARWIAQKPVL